MIDRPRRPSVDTRGARWPAVEGDRRNDAGPDHRLIWPSGSATAYRYALSGPPTRPELEVASEHFDTPT